MAQALPPPALRPLLPQDIPVLAAIFQASIEDLTGEDYSKAQQAAWAAIADDEAAFGRRLGQGLTLVATISASPIGFISLQGPETIDMLYVHPGAAGHGVASFLYDAIEKLARGRGAQRLTVDASDTARDFFEKRGFQPQRRNTITVGEEWLGNTTMEKRFDSPEQGLPSS